MCSWGEYLISPSADLHALDAAGFLWSNKLICIEHEMGYLTPEEWFKKKTEKQNV